MSIKQYTAVKILLSFQLKAGGSSSTRLLHLFHEQEEILLHVWKSLGRGIQWQHSTSVSHTPVLLPIPCPTPGWHRLLSSEYARTLTFPVKASCKKKQPLFNAIAQWLDWLIPKYKGIHLKSCSLPPFNGYGWAGYQLSCLKTFIWIVRSCITEIRASKQWKKKNCDANAKQWDSSPTSSL